MKRVICVITTLVILYFISGCGTESGGSSELWSLDDRKPISQEASYSDFNYDSGYDFPKELVPTYDQVQAQYPDKTVLIWAVDAFELGEAVRIREVNEYLTEQGYDFVMCTEPIYITGASGGNYPDRLVEGIQKELNAGKPVDIARSRIYSEFVSAKLFEPLDEYLENTDLGRKLHELMPEKYWECLRANGKIYGVCGSLNFMLNNDSGYFVNAELAEKYSFNLNKPILEQLDILQKIKREEKNCSVFVSDLLFYPAYYVSVKAIGDAVYWDGETHSAKCILDNAEYVEKLRFFDTLNREGLLSSRASAWGIPRSTFFISDIDRQGAAIGYDITETVEYNYNDDTISVIPVFSGTSAIRSYPYMVTGVCSGSKNKDKAFELLALTQTDPYLCNLLSFGVEGEDYTLTDGRVDNLIWFCSPAVFGNKLISYSYEGIYDADAEMYYPAEKYREILENANLPNDYDFCFDYSNLVDEMNATTDVIAKFKLPSGDKSLDDAIAELREKLEEAGIQEIIDECDRQYKVYTNEKS